MHPGGGHPPILYNVNEWVVCILLECRLVTKYCHKYFLFLCSRKRKLDMSSTCSCSSVVSSYKLIIHKVNNSYINANRSLNSKKTVAINNADKLLDDAQSALNESLAITKDCLGEEIETTVDHLLNKL